MTKQRRRRSCTRRHKKRGSGGTSLLSHIMSKKSQTRSRSQYTDNRPLDWNTPFTAEKYRYFLSGYKKPGEPCEEKFYNIFPLHPYNNDNNKHLYPQVPRFRMDNCKFVNYVTETSTEDDVNIQLLEFVSKRIKYLVYSGGDGGSDFYGFKQRIMVYRRDNNLRQIDYFCEYNTTEEKFHIFISSQVLHRFSIISLDNALIEEMPLEPTESPPTVFLFLQMHGVIPPKNIVLGQNETITNPESVTIFAPVYKDKIFVMKVRLLQDFISTPVLPMYEIIQKCLSHKKNKDELLNMCCYLHRNVFLENVEIPSRHNNPLFDKEYVSLSDEFYNNTYLPNNHMIVKSVQNTPGYHTYFHDKLYLLYDDRYDSLFMNRIEVVGLYNPNQSNQNQREFMNRDPSIPYDLRDRISYLKSRNDRKPLRLSDIIAETRRWFGIQNIVIFDYCCWETTDPDYIKNLPQVLANHQASEV